MNKNYLIFGIIFLLSFSYASAISELGWYTGLNFSDTGTQGINLVNVIGAMTTSSTQTKVFNTSYYAPTSGTTTDRAYNSGVTGVNGNTDFTLAFWVYPTVSFGAGDWCIIDIGAWTGTGTAACAGFENGNAAFLGNSNNLLINDSIATSTWAHYVYTYSSNKTITIFKNGARLGAGTLANNQNTQSFITIGNKKEGGFNGGFYAQDLRYYNFTFNESNANLMYNGGSGTSQPFPFGEIIPPINVSLTSNTSVGNRFITNNNIFVQALTSGISNFNTTIYLYNDTGLINYSISTSNLSSINYTNLAIGRYYFNATTTNGTNSSRTETRSIIIYNLTNGLFTNPISDYNLSSNNLSIVWSNATSTLNASNVTYYNITLLNSTGGFNRSLFSGLANNFSWSNIYGLNLSTGAYRLGLVAFDSNNNSVNSYSIPFNILTNALLNVTSNVVANIYLNGQSCISTYCNLDVVRGNSYSLIVNNESYSYYSIIINISNVAYSTWNVSLLPSNAINISIFKELDGTIINSTTTFTMDGAFTYYINGSGVISGLPEGFHTLVANNPAYRTRSYYVNVINRSFQSLNVYLNNGTAILFNYYDVGGNPLSGVLSRIYTYVNGSLVLVESKLSELGKVQWYSNSNTYYFFNSSKEGYTDYTFSLNPVVFTSYDIPMSEFISGNITPSAWVSFSPQAFYNGMNKSFVIKFVSPYGSLDSYSFRFTYPSGTISNSSNTSSGKTFTNQFSIPDTTTPYTILVFYNFTLSTGVTYNYTFSFITTAPWEDKTLANMGDNDYGMLSGDKIFWVTVMLLLLMGFAYLGAGVEIALLFGGILILIFINSGFLDAVSSTAFAVTGFAIILLLALRAWGNR